MEGVGTTAILLGVIIALTKVVEWMVRKYNARNGNCPKVTLGAEQTRQLRDLHEKFILFERDMDEMKQSNDKIADAMVKVSDCMQKISETNEKVAELVEKMDRRQEVEDEIRRRKPALVE